MVKKFLEIDPGRGQEDLKGLNSYICMNICEHFINVCVSERDRDSLFPDLHEFDWLPFGDRMPVLRPA
jgi:hypothetical protein